MKKEMKKILKRYLKKRRRVTESFIVMFFITGGIGYSEVLVISGIGNGIMEPVENNTGIIKGGADVTVGETVLRYSGIGVYGSVISNSGAIMGGVNTITDDLTSHSTSTTDAESYSYSRSDHSGNGVYGIRSNSGVIIGKIDVVTGDSTAASSHSTSGTYLESRSHSTSSLNDSGNGVYGSVESNSGVIVGDVNIATGNTSSLSDAASDYFSNSISGSGADPSLSGNGAMGVGNNTGVISGKVHGNTDNAAAVALDPYSMSLSTSSSWSFKSGNGVYGGVVYGGVVYGEAGSNSGVINGTVYMSTGNASSKTYADPSVYSESDSSSELNLSGNGVFGDTKSNRGVMTGNVKSQTGSYSVDGGNTWKKDYVSNYFSGNGLAYDQIFMENFYNSGLVAGSESAVALKDAESLTGSITNYGILAGREIIGDGTEIIANERSVEEISNIYNPPYGDMTLFGDLALLDLGTKYNNYGMEIKLNNNENRTVQSVINGSGGMVTVDGEKFTVLNTQIRGGTDSYKEINTDTVYDNHIINGAGINSGALTVDNSKVTLNNSIVNGYEKAVTLNGNSTLNAANTIFNGGGIGRWNDNGTPDDNMDDILEYTNVIEGDRGNNTISLLGSSIINGNIDLGGGADIMSIATAAQINGDIYGGNGTDRLNLGDSGGPLKNLRSSAHNLNIYHKISGFEDISVKGGVTLYETAKIKGAEKINIEANSRLNLRIDPTKKDGNDRITGHALYGSGAVITGAENTYEGIEGDTDGGALNIVTNGLGTGGIISMDTVTLDKNLYVRTNSIITQADLLDDGDIQVSAGQDLDEVASEVPINIDRYEKLNLVYKSIVTSGNKNIDALYPTANTSDKTESQAKEGLLLLLNEVFMANPYGYISRTSKDSMGLFNEMVLNNPFRANEGNWMVYGGLTFGGDDYDSSYKNHIKGNYYGFDTYGVDINADSSAYGGYVLAEYGVNKNTSVGFILGGANSNTDISNGSEIDGDSIYIGGYAKSKINNFKLTAGLGYQYSNYDTTRVAGNKYQSNKYEEDMRADGFSAYTGVSYDYALNNKWSLEPKLNLAYSRIIQDSVSEEGILSIEAEKESFNYVDTEIGMDLVRKISLDSGEGKFRLGLSYLYALKGSDADYVTGRFHGGSDFDILVPERYRGIAKIKGSYDVEYKSGIVYNVGGAYLPGDNRDEYYVSMGIGFKFNSLKDFIPAKSETVKVEESVLAEKVKEVPVSVKLITINEVESGFKLNRSELTEEMKGELNEVGKILSDKSLDGNIKITGHTDNTGPVKFNEKLSLERAKSARAVIENISKNENLTYTIQGKGSREPIATNETKAGRAKNRRVEVRYEGSKEK